MDEIPPPPKRYSSTEMTAVIPREHLPPISRRQVQALDLDPDHPETRDMMERAVDDEEDPREAPTMVPCPAGCRTCNCCGGRGLVASDEAALWRLQQADAKNNLPDDLA